jgi:hypothetical protein
MSHMMMKWLRAFLPGLAASADPDAVYLGQAVDIAELERRMRELQASR